MSWSWGGRRLIVGHLEDGRQMSILSGIVQDGRGLGRINRDEGSQRNVLGIVEDSQDTGRDGQPVEVNSGVYCIQADWLWENLDLVTAGSGPERYLTGLAAVAADQGSLLAAQPSDDPAEVRRKNLIEPGGGAGNQQPGGTGLS